MIAESSAVIPRRSRLLRPASPFKLRYLAFSSSPPPLLSLAARSREARRSYPRVRSAAGQAKSLVQEEPELGDRIPGPWTRTRISTRDGKADGLAADRRKARSPAVALDRSRMLKRRPAVETLEDENEDGAGDAIETLAATPAADESYLSLTRLLRLKSLWF